MRSPALLLLLLFAPSSILAHVVHVQPPRNYTYIPRLNQRPAFTRTKQRRDDPVPSAETCAEGDTCCAIFGVGSSCCSTVAPDPAPGGEERRRDGSIHYTGDILDPTNAVSFILSPLGTYTHTNGTVIPDRIYSLRTRNILERKAKKGVVSRFVAESLGKALLIVIPRSLMLRKLIEIMRYSGNDLFIASPQTAIRISDMLPTLELLAATPMFDGFDLHGYHYPKEAVAEAIEVLKTLDVTKEDAYDQAMAREDENFMF